MSIEVSGLSVTPFGEVTPVLDSLNFDIAAGERVLLLGPSGAGKSTLLLTLSGVLQSLESYAVQGQVRVPGSGLLLQNYSDASITDKVLRDVAFGAESAGFEVASVSALVAEALGRVGLAQLDTARNPETLSGGELQRMCLAGLLTLRPTVLLLDEPTSQLDAESAAAVRSAVNAYLEQSGATAIIAEHIFEPWLPLVNRVIVIGHTGQIEADGTWHRVQENQAAALEKWGLWFGQTAEAPKVDHSLTALVGPSGAGKSTELKRQLEAAMSQGERCGWAPQNPALALTGTTVLNCLTATATRAEAEDLLASLGLSHVASHNPHEISGGEQRRLALACAVVGNPKKLFLDEPTVGLDRHSWNRVMQLLQRIGQTGTSITVATHDDALIAAAGRVVRVEQMVESEPKNEPVPFTPLGMLAASAVALVAALSFRTWLGATVAVGLEAVLLGALALRHRTFWRPKLMVPLLIGIASLGFSNWWLSDAHDLGRGVLIGVRTAFFGLPGILFAAAASPSLLGDQLSQLLKVPARPVVAGMVGLNRVQRLHSTWQSLSLVRQVRGVARRGLREFVQLIGLSLLAATRGAMVASIAMEARGFSARDDEGRRIKRSWVVPARISRGDAWLVLATLVLGLVGALWR